MFKILLFFVALEPIILVSWMGLIQLNSGRLYDSLPSIAISIMCISYFISGVKEVVKYIKTFLK
jgi:hypothetical protein